MSCCCGNTETVVKVESGRGRASIDLPVKNRKCEDIPFLILFVLFVIGLIAGVIVAVCNGDIDRIINGMDSYGNVCGKDNTGKNEKFQSEFQKDTPNKIGQNMIERKYVQKADLAIPTSVTECKSKCDETSAYSEVFLNRCVPKNFQIEKGVSNALSLEGETVSFFKQAAGDIQFSWKEIALLCVGATVITLLIVLFLRYAAKVIIYITMILMVLVSTAGIVFVWYKYVENSQNRKTTGLNASTMRMQNARDKNMLVGAVMASILWLFFMLMLFAMRKRMKLVVTLFEESGKALVAIPFLMFQPLWTFLVLVLILCLWVYSLMWIQSAGYFEVVDAAGGKRLYLRQGSFQVLRWYFVFGLLWLAWFCFSCQNLVVASAVVKWFFTRDKSKLGSPILNGIYVTICYHLGSIAFGSFIIALIRFIRVFLQFIQRNLANSRNPNVTCIFCLVQCCIKCLESCIKYITRNAFIEIAMYGFSFCSGAKKAYQVLTSNAMNVAAINSIGDFALFLCKATVVIIISASATAIFTNKAGIENAWVPTVLTSFFAYLIADCFLSVYEMCIDTTFLCFCEDCEQNDGVDRPYFMSASLMHFVEETNNRMMGFPPPPKPQPAA